MKNSFWGSIEYGIDPNPKSPLKIGDKVFKGTNNSNFGKVMKLFDGPPDANWGDSWNEPIALVHWRSKAPSYVRQSKLSKSPYKNATKI